MPNDKQTATHNITFDHHRRSCDADKHSLYLILTTGWALLTVILLALVLVMDYQRFKNDFYMQAYHTEQHIKSRIKENEAVLEGFSAFIAALDRFDRERITQYCAQIHERFPHIFLFEVAQRVKATEIHGFIRKQKNIISPDFAIKAFDYADERTWKALPQKPYYFPLIYQYPLREASRQVLGLDLTSHEHIRKPLQRAIKTGTYQTSVPFRLIEGDKAYLMFLPVSSLQNHRRMKNARPLQPNYLVLIVLLADQLLANIDALLDKSTSILIHHNSRQPSDPSGQLINKTVASLNPLPVVSYRTSLEEGRNGLILQMEKQFGIESMSLEIILFILAAALMIFLFIRLFIMRRYERDMLRSRQEASLALLANYDALTNLHNLPNRNLLKEYLSAQIENPATEISLAALFLDLERFKQINDRYGHRIGDIVLQTTAQRIQRCLRKDDIAVRLGGDEFLVLISKVASSETIRQIADKIRKQIEKPIEINELNLSISASIGIAMYPEQTDAPLQLIHLADQMMYKDKLERAKREERKSG